MKKVPFYCRPDAGAIKALAISFFLLSQTFSPLCAGQEFMENLVPLAGKKPNIVVVLTDDQGYGQLGCQGHPFLKTPSIDSPYNQSIAFSAFHVSPTCSPTRAALMTGNVPFKNGVTHTGGSRARLVLSAVTLPQLLKDAGYTTGIFGKWHLGCEREAYQPGSRGFDEVFIHGYGGIGQAKDVPGNKYMDPIIRHNDKFVQTRGFCTDVFFTQALGWIKQNKNRRFFAYISTNAPHGPFVAPPENQKRFVEMGLGRGQPGFYGMIENIDENVGRLLSCLKRWGLEENTLVVFLSDNGFVHQGTGVGKIGTHNGKPVFAYNAGMKGWKRTVHEGGTRVPALFRWKGVLKEGVECASLTAHIDILPTLVELAGGLRAANWHYMNYGEKGEELYDMSKDPHQYTNVANDPAFAAMLKEARAKFKARIAAAR